MKNRVTTKIDIRKVNRQHLTDSGKHDNRHK